MDTTIPRVGQFADLRGYLVQELITHSKELREDPENRLSVVKCLDGFPETLNLLREVGQEESHKSDLPYCFSDRIDHLIEQVDRLRSNIEGQTFAAAQAPRILIEMTAHLGRLTLHRRDCSDYVQTMDIYATEISEGYGLGVEDSLRRIGYDEAEAFLVWRRLNRPTYGCDCHQCSPQVEDSFDA